MKIRKLISGIMSGIITLSVGCFPVRAAESVSLSVGSGGYAGIQQAIDSVKAGQSAVITVAPGTYTEPVVVNKPNIRLVNPDKNKKVIITYDRGPGHTDPEKNLGTEKSATFMVTEDADNFTAENITFQNTFNIGTDFEQGQAVAFESLADKVVLDNCSFIGRQDTLYLKGASKGKEVYGSANPARVYLKNCYIEGTVDFIFGDASAYFEKCKLHMIYRENGGHFTAANTTLFNTGYVFDKCTFTTDDAYKTDEKAAAKVDLGRPWQADSAYPNGGSQTVLLNCKVSDTVKKEGFSAWDANTVVNKVRYYEYATEDLSGKPVDLSKRGEIVRILTDEQAQAYNAYSVLCGTDGWNPANAPKTKDLTLDVTLDKYDVSIPQGESAAVKAFVIGSGGVSWSSGDTNIASVDSNGKITAVSQGSTVVTAKTANGFCSNVNVSVTAPRTPVPTIKDIKIDHISTFEPGTTMTVNYSYALESDNKSDSARISWYLIKNNDEILLKSGVGAYYKKYTIESSDIGGSFKAVVEPATKTTYGTYGKGVEAKDNNVVSGGSTGLILKTGFNEGASAFETKGSWKTVKANANSLITAGCDEKNAASLELKEKAEDPSLKVKFRFNPEQGGMSAEDNADIFINYNEGTGYRLNIKRGSNTKSLKAYLYKKTADAETLLASDETSMKNNIPQNTGNDNPFFYVEFYKKADMVTATFTLEGSDSNLVKLIGRDTAPLPAGGIYFEFIGKTDVWMFDTLSYENGKSEKTENAVHVYLAGDSTVKDYGASNTIGGWGEFIGDYFTDDVVIVNKAEGGRSTRSYINQGRLDEILSLAKPGDYMFIQFGHNDARTDDAATMEHKVQLGTPDENGIYPSVPAVKTKTPQYIIDFYKNDSYPYSDTFYSYETGTFKWYYEQFVEKAREKGMIPVVITPVCRVFFDADGKITPHFGEDNGYVEAVRQVAKEQNCPLIDMYNITSSLYESYGVLTTQGLHNVNADGNMDLTHYNKFGANLIASKMAESLKEQNIAIAKETKNSNVSVGRVDEMKSAKLFVIGDSMAENNKDELIASAGIASKLPRYFADKISVVDYTSADATAKSFAKSKQYDEFISSVNTGDYVLLNFGRTDSDKSSADRILDFYSDVKGDVNTKDSFKYYMYNSYIKPLTEKKAVIIAVTPVTDGNFKNGELVNSCEAYAQAVRELVTENSLYFVDLNGQSAETYTNMGENGSKVLNAIDKKKGIERNRLSDFGADTFARAFVNSMKYSSATLKNYINDSELSTPDPLTKAEYVSAIVSVLGDNAASGTNFKDVVTGKEYYNDVLTAKNIGIAKADFRGEFKPEEQIYGNDAVKILKAAVTHKNIGTKALDNVYELMPYDKAVTNEIGLYAAVRLYEVVYR